MATTASRQQAYITEAKAQTQRFWEAFLLLKSLQEEWTSNDYTNNLADGTGENDGYSAAEVGAVVNTTINAVDTLLVAGHKTNITALL